MTIFQRDGQDALYRAQRAVQTQLSQKQILLQIVAVQLLGSSTALLGLSVYLVEIEVDAASGMPAWDIVGLPDTAVKESKERVRRSLWQYSLFSARRAAGKAVTS